MNSNIRINSQRNYMIDCLKTIAIISVVLYHMGMVRYGYLGVEIFLVINGFLVTKGIIKSIREDRFSYFTFLYKKIVRLLPLILIVSAFCLILGYFVMLPDDYENLAQSVVATNFFANNVLSCITTRDYWAIYNEYKPLMHTWYLGVLMQSYFVLPLVPMLTKRIKKNSNTFAILIIGAVILLSVLINILSIMSTAERFYYLPFRLFEIFMGSMLAYISEEFMEKNKKEKCYSMKLIGMLMLAVLLFVPITITSDFFRLMCVCVITMGIIFIDIISEEKTWRSGINEIVTFVGKRTFSIFMWHQVILAFIRYAIRDVFTWKEIFIYLIIVIVVSLISYLFIEVKLEEFRKQHGKRCVGICALSFVLIVGVSLWIYIRAGVVRSVPELEIDKNNVYRNMHAEYCDRGYNYDIDFQEDGRKKIIVIGNSFARDWINVLLESDISEEIEISYIYPYSEEYILERMYRINGADYVFYALSNNEFIQLPDYLNDSYEEGKVYIVGNKNFGTSNGIVYNRRFMDDYFDSSIIIEQEYLVQNNKLKMEYTDHYIDMIECVQNTDGTIKVFTEDNYFISHDCIHLTRQGARYYSEIIDLSWLIENES